MSAQKTHPAPVRRNLGVIDISRFARCRLAFSFLKQLFRGPALQIIPGELPRGDKKQRLRARRPQISGRLNPAQARLLPPRGRREKHIPQKPSIPQPRPLSIPSVPAPNFPPPLLFIPI